VKKRQGYGDCGSRLSDRKSDGHCETRTSYNGEGDKTSSLFSQTFVGRKHHGSDLRTEFKPKRGDRGKILMVGNPSAVCRGIVEPLYPKHRVLCRRNRGLSRVYFGLERSCFVPLCISAEKGQGMKQLYRFELGIPERYSTPETLRPVESSHCSPSTRYFFRVVTVFVVVVTETSTTVVPNPSSFDDSVLSLEQVHRWSPGFPSYGGRELDPGVGSEATIPPCTD